LIRWCVLLTTALNALPDLPLSSWTDPSFEDYVEIQSYLEQGARKELEALSEFDLEGNVLNTFRIARMRKFKLIDVNDTHQKVPKLKTVHINTSASDKNCCIITYTSCNDPYQQLPVQLEKTLRNTGFKGHFLSRVGGWPYVKGGSLGSIDTPYAFKPCMFKEAMALGYRYIIWLDVATSPRKSLDSLIKELKKHQALFFNDPIPLTFPSYQYVLKTRTDVCDALQTNWEGIKRTPHLIAQCIAFDVHDKNVRRVIDAWYQLALGKTAYLSLAPEQIPLSFLVHKHLRNPKIYRANDLSSFFLTTPH
jgi:hypothetical protein